MRSMNNMIAKRWTNIVAKWQHVSPMPITGMSSKERASRSMGLGKVHMA